MRRAPAVSYDVTIATHVGQPNGAPDDIALADALADLGARCRFAVWNDPGVDWRNAPITVARSTWDYHRSPSTWRDWLETASCQTRLVNDVDLLRWNTDKRYLTALSRSGVDIVPTHIIDGPLTSHEIGLRIARTGWDDYVVKPAIAASADGARRFNLNELGAASLHAQQLLAKSAVLVQPFQPTVLTERERSLVMLGGDLSHAFTKRAFDPGAAAGELIVTAWTPTDSERALAAKVLQVLPIKPVYARVDLVPSGSGPLLMELELIEPRLGLTGRPLATRRLAELLLNPDGRH